MNAGGGRNLCWQQVLWSIPFPLAVKHAVPAPSVPGIKRAQVVLEHGDETLIDAIEQDDFPDPAESDERCRAMIACQNVGPSSWLLKADLDHLAFRQSDRA
jgi:hypothetical protein